jgi:SIR2-like domain
MPISLSQDFFALGTTKKSIHELAEAETLVLFLGSGVSASQGLPVWTQLLRRLLDRAALAHPNLTDENAREEFSRTLLRTTDPMIVGSIVRRLYPGQETFYDALKTAIYSDVHRGGRARPASNFCRAVWELIFTRYERGLRTLAVTTNYDDVLEVALESDVSLRSLAQSLGIHYARPVYGEAHRDGSPENAMSIHHIHGYIPAEGPERVDPDRIVLSAKDYGHSWADHWSYGLLSEVWEAQWLFVGMSFHDPHITFFLTEKSAQAPTPLEGAGQDPELKPPRGVFSLQGQPWASLADNTKLALARAEVSRLGELGMFALPTSYFFQDAQLLREIALRTRLSEPKAYVTYVERRARWSDEFAEQRVSMEGRPVVKDLLERIHKRLQELRVEIERLAPHDEERFKVELWCRNVDERGLFQIGSSEFLPYETTRSRRYALSTDLPIAAVQAFTAGAPITTNVRLSSASRWQHYYGIPITLGDEPWFELPVGALVVASSAPEAASTLSTQAATIEARLEGWIESLVPFLNPGEDIDGGLKGLITKLLP